MCNLNEISGKRFTLILTAISEGEDDWAVLPGVAQFESGTLFIERGPRPRFEVRPEWIDRIKPVEPPLRGIFRGADYYLALTVDNVGEGFVLTGLGWPD